MYNEKSDPNKTIYNYQRVKSVAVNTMIDKLNVYREPLCELMTMLNAINGEVIYSSIIPFLLMLRVVSKIAIADIMKDL